MSLSSLLPLPWLAPSLYYCSTASAALSRSSPSCRACTTEARRRWKRERGGYSAVTSSRSVSSSSSSSSPPQDQQSRQASSSGTSTTTTTTMQQVFHTAKGKVKVDLTRRALVGVHQSRGERPYQEDSYAIANVNLPKSEILRSLSSSSSFPSSRPAGAPGKPPSGIDGNPGKASTDKQQSREINNVTTATSNVHEAPEDSYEQTLYCAVFDGHNGSAVSNFLRDHLHERILQVASSEANSIISSYRALGGYMRRYRGGPLEGLVDPPAPRRTAQIARTLQRAREEEQEDGSSSSSAESNSSSSSPYDAAKSRNQNPEGCDAVKSNVSASQSTSEQPPQPWSIVQRLHAAFLKTDLEIIKTEQEAGSTSTVALLHSLDEPRAPFFASEELNLMIAHCGDTRAILCTVPDGEAVPLTETHHPEARSETDRLMRIRTGAVTDSFGESRWAGSLANTRSFGDAHYKALGVFSEPQIVTKRLRGSSYAFLILISDGVTEKLSDQEICDLVRGYTSDASAAARNVVSFAESVGAQDNLTCVVVPLPGWGQVTSQDSTKKRREFRLANFEGRSNRQNRM